MPVSLQLEQLPSPTNSNQNVSSEEKIEIDNRSVYVGNVDYGATTEELKHHFRRCGSVIRVTIPCNKGDGQSKGFAYVEFADNNSVQMAMTLDHSLLRGRQIKVMPKRINRPGIVTTGRGMMKGREGRGRGGYMSSL